VKSVRERYLTDKPFCYIVDCMRAIISSAQLTPSEVREAAMLACIIEAEHRPAQPLVLTNGEVEMLSDYLRRQSGIPETRCLTCGQMHHAWKLCPIEKVTL
jgi:hypothetical protein